jgi:hypothetical protein
MSTEKGENYEESYGDRRERGNSSLAHEDSMDSLGSTE